MLMKFRPYNHTSGSFKMHACVLPLNIDQTEHTFLHPQGHVRKKWLKITTPTTLCLTCVIALQIHHNTEPTGMPVLLYSFHIKRIFQNLIGHKY